MPTVTFVNEHRHVEVEKGRLLSEIASELGILTCREEFAGTGIGDYTVWIEGEPSAVSPLTWYERIVKRCKGQRRQANRTKVLGDIKVWTQGGIGSRVGVPRPLDPAPRAGEDGSERFDHEHDPAGTAWHPYGHPYAVGQGNREPKKYEPPQKKKRAAKKKPAPKKAEAKKDDDGAEAKAADKPDKPAEAKKDDGEKAKADDKAAEAKKDDGEKAKADDKAAEAKKDDGGEKAAEAEKADAGAETSDAGEDAPQKDG